MNPAQKQAERDFPSKSGMQASFKTTSSDVATAAAILHSTAELMTFTLAHLQESKKNAKELEISLRELEKAESSKNKKRKCLRWAEEEDEKKTKKKKCKLESWSEEEEEEEEEEEDGGLVLDGREMTEKEVKGYNQAWAAVHHRGRGDGVFVHERSWELCGAWLGEKYGKHAEKCEQGGSSFCIMCNQCGVFLCHADCGLPRKANNENVDYMLHCSVCTDGDAGNRYKVLHLDNYNVDECD
jgi:hypothetical protein